MRRMTLKNTVPRSLVRALALCVSCLAGAPAAHAARPSPLPADFATLSPAGGNAMSPQTVVHRHAAP